ncbi:leucine-rich repeat domain-containing protein [archaeon]|nr:MAG: leucine-rich repeat domain-containing protein [archaeon]
MSLVEKKRKGNLEDKKKSIIWQTALYDASIQDGDLRLTWNPLKVIDDVIYTFHTSFGFHLRSVRLVGIELSDLPSEFCTELPKLEILSVENNLLTSLPDTLTTLTSLRELNLVNNKLEYLPDRIGFLCSLQKISLNNNCLRALPASFGALNNIERLDLECNYLSVLPENLDNMLLCRAINVNRNKLTRLPRCVGRMPSLTQFSASVNSVTYIPQEFCTSSTLTHLRLSKNLINSIPDRIGDLHQLVELCLEYNKISKLPVSFYKLQRLKVLRLEGNEALLDPPSEILIEGAKRVVKFCFDTYMSDKQGRMRHIILTSQNVLQQIADRGVYDPAFFEPEARIGSNAEDLWVGLQLTHFWNDLIPRMNQIWEALLRRYYEYQCTFILG